jgi:hypothetical protein
LAGAGVNQAAGRKLAIAVLDDGILHVYRRENLKSRNLYLPLIHVRETKFQHPHKTADKITVVYIYIGLRAFR